MKKTATPFCTLWPSGTMSSCQKVEDWVHVETINDNIFKTDSTQIHAIIMLAGHATVRPTPLPAKMHAELPYIAVCRAEITEHERKKMTAACTRCMRPNLDHAQKQRWPIVVEINIYNERQANVSDGPEIVTAKTIPEPVTTLVPEKEVDVDQNYMAQQEFEKSLRERIKAGIAETMGRLPEITTIAVPWGSGHTQSKSYFANGDAVKGHNLA